jgi:hypothetical protein
MEIYVDNEGPFEDLEPEEYPYWLWMRVTHTDGIEDFHNLPVDIGNTLIDTLLLWYDEEVVHEGIANIVATRYYDGPPVAATIPPEPEEEE